jgi:hypothetical protein
MEEEEKVVEKVVLGFLLGAHLKTEKETPTTKTLCFAFMN